MIDYLKGRIADKKEDYCIVDTHGLGYRVYMPSRIIDTLLLDSDQKVFTHHHFREDSQELYGFSESKDRDIFQLLISVSGVGPKVALKALSQFDAATLLNALSQEDIDTLTQISGVGKKGAERMIIELKDKCGQLGFEVSMPNTVNYKASSLDTDISAALKQLGYDNQEIKHALANSLQERSHCKSVEESLKVLLKFL